MEVRFVTEKAPGRDVNEDAVFAFPDMVGVLDGASVLPGMQTGCIHGPAWYVGRLAAWIGLANVRLGAEGSLSDVLAVAIEGVAAEHASTCDLSCSETPASTVTMVRARGDVLEYLVLCDSPLVLDLGGPPVVVDDRRFADAMATLKAEVFATAAPIGSPGHAESLARIARHRRDGVNQEGGYWVAAANPEAAHHAVTGSLPLRGADRVRTAALLTDGAADAVDLFGFFDWPGLMQLLRADGPSELIRQIRTAELADKDGLARPRYKRHDDVTVALCLFDQEVKP